MTYCSVERKTTLTTPDYKNAIQIWRNYGPVAQMLIGRVVVEKLLTASQERRMPAGLRRVLSVK